MSTTVEVVVESSSLGYRLGGRRLFPPDAKKFLANLERLEGSSNG